MQDVISAKARFLNDNHCHLIGSKGELNVMHKSQQKPEIGRKSWLNLAKHLRNSYLHSLVQCSMMVEIPQSCSSATSK
jgi:hypothetical protein